MHYTNLQIHNKLKVKEFLSRRSYSLQELSSSVSRLVRRPAMECWYLRQHFQRLLEPSVSLDTQENACSDTIWYRLDQISLIR